MNVKIKTHYTSLQGRRKENEDTHFIEKNKVWSIHDGHGGKFISYYLKKKLGPKLLRTKMVNTEIKKLYVKLHDDIKMNYLEKAKEQGSTALSIVLYNKNKLKIMNLGDCRAVLCRDNLAIPLTKDHKPYWDDEHKRILDLGGKVKRERGDDWRVGNLSVSRAFGDLDLEKYISHIPDIFGHTITSKDQFIIMACDGLWDVIENQDAVHFVNNNLKNTNIAKSLAEHAIRKGSTDNVSVIILFFSHKSISKPTFKQTSKSASKSVSKSASKYKVKRKSTKKKLTKKGK